ncbi:VWA domain-containing protein [Hyphomicrobium sp. 99]|uniref:vWA domain-containing protein n=1 Tax=Hyphomicrobium sp. 99 TaxID=1163419 RepID=UPI0018CFAF08|nr:vWA domain-containing protein [Hyphomicrobium sp. 99]
MTEATTPETAPALTTSIVMVLDRSGSMSSCRDATIKSVNSYLKEAKGDANLKDASFDLMIFDSQSIDTIRSGTIKAIEDITREDFMPRGGTPLLDAIGRGVDSLDKKAADGKAILVVVTDGEENSSRKHNYESIKALISTRQDKGWLVIFLGAGLDSAKQGLAMGISSANVANIGLDEQSLAATASFMSVSSAAYGATRSMAEAKGYAGSEKISRSLRMSMGDKSGGAGIVDNVDAVIAGMDKTLVIDDPWAKKIPPQVSRSKTPPKDVDAWADTPADSWGA